MLELALRGSKRYYGWMGFLLAIVGVGFLIYLKQLDFGLGITGMSRDVSWGFYIAQFTFLVGVAAGGVMVVLPYYLHDYKAYGRITILGEFLAIAADEETLQSEWVQRSVRKLCDVLRQCRGIDLECGVLYHALHGLVEYQRRLA